MLLLWLYTTALALLVDAAANPHVVMRDYPWPKPPIARETRESMQIQFRSALERVRDSQFLIPALFIAAGLGLVVVTNELDDQGAATLVPINSSVASARTLLASVAGAIVTVAALVFSLSAVTMQLAASQYSPRVLQIFSRDRQQQVAVGLAMGTFTYALGALATLPVDGGGTIQTSWTVSVAIGLAVVTVLVIVFYVDRVTRRVRIDDAIERISAATQSAFERQDDLGRVPAEPWDPTDVGPGSAVRATDSGFVQAIDFDGMIRVLPQRSIVRLDIWIGHFVTEGQRLATVWTDAGALGDALVDPIAIGPQRTIEQDPGFGIRSLVDIALRALSTGVNDPATAADVVRHLAGCVRAAYLAGDPGHVFSGPDSARLFTPLAPTAADHLSAAFPPIRRAATDQPLVLVAISDALSALDDELGEIGIDGQLVGAEAAAAKARFAEIETTAGGSVGNNGSDADR